MKQTKNMLKSNKGGRNLTDLLGSKGKGGLGSKGKGGPSVQ
jgi:hypothetical protein